MKRKFSLLLAIVMTMMFSTVAWGAEMPPIERIDVTIPIVEGETVQDVLGGITMSAYGYSDNEWNLATQEEASIDYEGTYYYILKITKAGEDETLEGTYKLVKGESYELHLPIIGSNRTFKKNGDGTYYIYDGIINLNGKKISFASTNIVRDGESGPYNFSLLVGFVVPEVAAPASNASAHVHNFTWQTITAPTKDSDGLEGEVCSCGAMRNTQPLSAYGYALNEYATPMINAAKAGQTITFEFGEWNSFPKNFMAKIVDKSAQNVTFVFHYKWNHVKQEIIIPAGTPIDLNFDWYGPAKMVELYGVN